MMNIFGNGSTLCISENSTQLAPIRVINDHTAAITGIALLVTIPTGLEYLIDDPSHGTFDDGTNIWTIPTLGAGVTATLDLCFTVTDDTTGPWEITYSATHDVNPDSNPGDDSSQRDIEGFPCSAFYPCYETLQEFDSMEDAIEALGPGRPFLYSLENTEGATYRGLHVTPLT